MLTINRTGRALVGLALLSAVSTASHANAGTPRTTKLYFHGSGCGDGGLSDSWLDTIDSEDTGTGCGLAGGIPYDEVFGALRVDFTTRNKTAIKLDSAHKVTGVYAVCSWYAGTTGVGDVTVDIDMTARTKTGTVINFGSFSGTVSPPIGTMGHVDVPFYFTPPRSAKGKVLTQVTLSAAAHGANLGWNAYCFSGNSYVNIPGFK